MRPENKTSNHSSLPSLSDFFRHVFSRFLITSATETEEMRQRMNKDREEFKKLDLLTSPGKRQRPGG